MKVLSTCPKSVARWDFVGPAEPVILSGRVYVFTDGSSLGGYGAVMVVRPGAVGVEASSWTLPTATRNVGAELNGAILGLGLPIAGAAVTLVFDYMGVGAWLTGSWKIKNPEVANKVKEMQRIIHEKKLHVSYIHHRGHGTGSDDFTKFNAVADRLAGEANERKK